MEGARASKIWKAFYAHLCLLFSRHRPCVMIVMGKRRIRRLGQTGGLGGAILMPHFDIGPEVEFQAMLRMAYRSTRRACRSA